MSESQRAVSTPRRDSTWKAYMQEEVTAVWGDAVLIVGCFATGLLDSAVFNVWSCFVSMQTGEPHQENTMSQAHIYQVTPSTRASVYPDNLHRSRGDGVNLEPR